MLKASLTLHSFSQGHEQDIVGSGGAGKTIIITLKSSSLRKNAFDGKTKACDLTSGQGSERGEGYIDNEQ